MPRLILIRHGQSTWNEEGLFTGWVDVDLTTKGEDEARQAGALLAEAGLLPEVVHTSLLTRAIRTANLALENCGRSWIPVRRDWRLNERHYGGLQGKNKVQTKEEFGEKQLLAWRRSYDTPPPPIERGSQFDVSNDPRYQDLTDAENPLSESLKDVVARTVPYYESEIIKDLETFDVVLVAAHGNSLRALVKFLENISDDEITKLEIPTGVPRVYKLGGNFEIQEVSELGDAAAIAAAREATANQANKAG